jgi:hypothetical protein
MEIDIDIIASTGCPDDEIPERGCTNTDQEYFDPE